MLFALPAGSAVAYAGEATATQATARALELADDCVPVHAAALHALARFAAVPSRTRLALLALLVRRAAQAADDDENNNQSSGKLAGSRQSAALLVGDASFVDHVLALARVDDAAPLATPMTLVVDELWRAVGVLLIVAARNVATLGCAHATRAHAVFQFDFDFFSVRSCGTARR